MSPPAQTRSCSLRLSHQTFLIHSAMNHLVSAFLLPCSLHCLCLLLPWDRSSHEASFVSLAQISEQTECKVKTLLFLHSTQKSQLHSVLIKKLRKCPVFSSFYSCRECPLATKSVPTPKHLGSPLSLFHYQLPP